MGRNRDKDGIKSNMIIAEVQKRPWLYDCCHPDYGDRSKKVWSWEEICSTVVPSWGQLDLHHKYESGKEVQKRWRSIRDSYTKAYRQGRCVTPAPTAAPQALHAAAPALAAAAATGAQGKRHTAHRHLAFLNTALENRKKKSTLNFENISDISNSPQHVISEDLAARVKLEPNQDNIKIPPEKQNQSDQDPKATGNNEKNSQQDLKPTKLATRSSNTDSKHIKSELIDLTTKSSPESQNDTKKQNERQVKSNHTEKTSPKDDKSDDVKLITYSKRAQSRTVPEPKMYKNIFSNVLLEARTRTQARQPKNNEATAKLENKVTESSLIKCNNPRTETPTPNDIDIQDCSDKPAIKTEVTANIPSDLSLSTASENAQSFVSNDDTVQFAQTPLSVQNRLQPEPLPMEASKTDNPQSRPVDSHQNTTSSDRNVSVELKNPSVEIKIDANSILPEENLDDDKLFLGSLLPLFKKMSDDTRLLCRIEVLKVVRCALQGRGYLQCLRAAEDNYFRTRLAHYHSTLQDPSPVSNSARSGRPIRKRKHRSPSPPAKPDAPKRGRGRPRKVVRPASDSEWEAEGEGVQARARGGGRGCSVDLARDRDLAAVTSVTQLKTPQFMKVYNLGPSQKYLQSRQGALKPEPDP